MNSITLNHLPPVYVPVNYVTGNTQCVSTLTKTQGLLEVTPQPPVSDAVILYKAITAIKAYGGEEVKLHSTVTMTVDRGEWSVSHISWSTAKERKPSTHQTGSRKGIVVKITMTYIYKGRVPKVVKHVGFTAT